LQRLQSEMQMLLYNHPVNNARDARRQISVNSFWLRTRLTRVRQRSVLVSCDLAMALRAYFQRPV
jgi:hypothetical protein